MNKARLEAFSDGVLAIIITIMVLELKAPHGDQLGALRELLPVFLSYVLSFIYVGIYWNNHHHMLHAARQVNGTILWANLQLLFWLSLIPFTTAWMGENHFSGAPTAAYGAVLLMSALAYYVLQRAILAAQGGDTALATAIGKDIKGKISPLLYATGVVVACVEPIVAQALYLAVALMWLVPDRRVERALHARSADKA